MGCTVISIGSPSQTRAIGPANMCYIHTYDSGAAGTDRCRFSLLVIISDDTDSMITLYRPLTRFRPFQKRTEGPASALRIDPIHQYVLERARLTVL
jgi:hypothetical protein